MSFINLSKFESTIDNKIIRENRETLYLDSYKIIIDEYTSDFLNLNLSKYTVFRLRFNNPFNFNLSLTLNNFINNIEKNIYDNTIKTNDDIFNSKFISTTNNKKLATKFLNINNIRKILLKYANKSSHPIYDVHISDWKNSTFLSTKECQGELRLLVSGVIQEESIKQEYLIFLKKLISTLQNIKILYHE